MTKFRLVFAAALFGAPLAFPVETLSWVHNSKEDFEKGTLRNLSLRSDGRLSLAPAFREIADPSVAYLWALAVDAQGNVYAGGGGPGASRAKLLTIDAAGKSRVLAELPGLQIQSIATDRQGRVYAATAPDGKVYRVNPSDGKFEDFYDPGARYIWSIAFSSKGDLYVATGDSGEVHRVDANGKGSVFFRTEETHARSLALDSKDNLIVGTEPGGLVLRISPAGDGFVLYQGAKREVTAVAVAPDGSIYAAAIGNKGAPAMPAPVLSLPPAPPPPANAPASAGHNRPTVQPVPFPPAATATPATPASVAGGSEVYRIGTDGQPQRVWSHAQDVVYAIAFDAQARPVLGTGNRGNIYQIHSQRLSTLMIDAAPTQITALAAGAGGRLYAATGNVGKVYQIGPGAETQGIYESEPLDVGSFAFWGRATSKVDGGSAKIETRTGNLDRPQKNWSAWAPLDAAARVSSPSARFLQYRLTLTGSSPELREVEVAYMARNVAPSIEEIDIPPANYRFNPPAPLAAAPAPTLTLPALGQRRRTVPPITLDTGSAGQTMQYARGHAGVRWLATDPNGDDMIFTVEIRGVNEQEWKPLREKVKEKFLSWDTTTYPDGQYVLRITASDAPDNPPDRALSFQLESDRFTIDNTPPEITGLTTSRAGGKLNVEWSARDERSVIGKAEYSLNGAEWIVAEPDSRLSDSSEHTYSITLDNAGGEATVAIRVTDEFDNQAVDKAVVRR